MLTPYQSKYIAWLLDRNRCSSDEEKFTSVLTEAKVDLNPHQIEAALFAFHSPLAMGAVLADEVGLGKTIEAALVIAQQWAKHCRHILIIAPATLRKQWSAELEEKFYLPSIILERKNFNAILADTYQNPFSDTSRIVICSYQFAKKQMTHISRVEWDLVVMDEAHKLRNVYKGNKTALAIKTGLSRYKKLLLTATPLQNNVKELYGLVSIVDDSFFGSLKGFTDQYGRVGGRSGAGSNDLRERIKTVIHRTLRSQVQEYVKYTERRPFVQDYYPSDDEMALEELVTEYLQRDECYGMPLSQRQLISLVLHKLLSSSTFAIAGTLQTIIHRLQTIVDKQKAETDILNTLKDDVEELDDYADEWVSEEDEEDETEEPQEDKEYTAEDIEAIKAEIADLLSIYALAMGIASNTKGQCLLKALEIAFADKRKHGQPEKALIFTESRRTQEYLRELLEKNGYQGRIVLFSGGNSNPEAKAIYAAWKERNAGTSAITGSTTADKRQALVDYFRSTAQIMIATEAAAEGINLQFCSLVVNYDMPWNPQRVEQRIGRCHRYGQKNDVVVVNFVNKANRADQRVYQLLDEKYNLFKGVFGSSDEVIGSTMDGVDFERRVLDIYRQCRTTEEIDHAFDLLQAQLQDEIEETLHESKLQLIENFDQDVVSKLRLRRDSTEASLTHFQQLLWMLTLSVAGSDIKVNHEDDYSFSLLRQPQGLTSPLPTGPYRMGHDVSDAYTYRIGHPLAQYILDKAKHADTTQAATVEFSYTGSAAKVSILEQAVGSHGVLVASVMHFSSPKDSEDSLVAVAFNSEGTPMPDDFVSKLMALPAQQVSGQDVATDVCNEPLARAQEQAADRVAQRNKTFVADEARKIERWADDQTFAAEQELRNTKRLIKEKNRLLPTATGDDFQRLRSEIDSLTRQQRRQRANIFAVEDEIDRQRQTLMNDVEASLHTTVKTECLFRLAWRIV